MTAIPDGVEVVSTTAESVALELPALLVLDPVTGFLDAHGLGSGPFTWERIGDGQSNITYRIDRGSDTFVLRRGPRPPIPRSTHDMVREAKLQLALHAAGFPVPHVLAVCEDESLLGVPFYVMSYEDGVVLLDTLPAGFAGHERETSVALIDTLVRLHSVDLDASGLGSFGRPDGYLRRQVERFGALWEHSAQRSIPDVAILGSWLGDNLPVSVDATCVHGDYRAGNLLFARSAPPDVAAVLDWEMATVGDPLADVGYFLSTYSDRTSDPTFMELSPVTRGSGFLQRTELATEYERATGRDLSALPWYRALALWKAAIFSEDMYTRWLKGERPGDLDFAPKLEAGIPALLKQARSIAGV